MQDLEVWKPIGGRYFVSSLGRVKSLKKSGERILKPDTTKRGYLRVTIHIHSRPQRYMVHRLVGKYFCDNYNPELTINHKNNVKNDNRAINLEWVSIGDNIRKCISDGLRNAPKGDTHWTHRNPEKTTRGEKIGTSKLSLDQVREIKTLYPGISQRKIAAKFGIVQQQVSRIIKGKRWSWI